MNLTGKAFIDPTGAPGCGYRRMSIANATVLSEALPRAKGGRGIDVLAREMGVSRRTLYRWRGARFHDVTVDGWTAMFICRPGHLDGAPVQATPWREVEP